MSLFFLRDEVHDLLAVIEEIAQTVNNLRLGDVQSVSNFQDRFAAKIESGDMANGDSQTVDEWFPSTDGFSSNDVGVVGFNNGIHDSAVCGRWN